MTTKLWKVMPGTYENGTMLKVIPVNNNDSTYVLVGGADRDAIAHLVAAAPDLKEALKSGIAAIEYLHGPDSTITKSARAAIAEMPT